MMLVSLYLLERREQWLGNVGANSFIAKYDLCVTLGWHRFADTLDATVLALTT